MNKTNQEIIDEFKKEFINDENPEVEMYFKDPNGDAYLVTQWILKALEAKDEQARQEMIKLVEEVPDRVIWTYYDQLTFEEVIRVWKTEQLNQLKDDSN